MFHVMFLTWRICIENISTFYIKMLIAMPPIIL